MKNYAMRFHDKVDKTYRANDNKVKCRMERMTTKERMTKRANGNK